MWTYGRFVPVVLGLSHRELGEGHGTLIFVQADIDMLVLHEVLTYHPVV